MKRTLRAVLAALMLALWTGCALGEAANAPLAFAITPEEAALTIQAAGGLEKLGVDKQLQFTAAFAAPEKINKKNGNNQVRWSLVDQEGKEIEARLASIDENGLLRTALHLKEGINAVVVAESTAFATRAEYPLLLYPPVQQLRLSPNALTILPGQQSAPVQVSTVPPGLQKALTWRISKPEVASFAVNEDGSVTVFAIGPGTARLTAFTDSGIWAYIPLEVPRIETSIRILGDEYVRQGGVLELSADLGDHVADSREVDWSVDVDESMATISAAGRLRPAIDCPVGTRITVTCRPKYAAENVCAVKEVVVTYAAFKLNRK